MGRLPLLIDAEESFKRGDSFLLAHSFMESQPVEILAPCSAAHVTISAFCVEIYMKVLAQLERGEPPLGGHDLKRLAHDLTFGSFRRIERAWKMANKESLKHRNRVPDWARIPAKFDEALRRSAKAFVEWRYGEGSDLRSWYLGGVSEELRAIILERKPEWRPLSGPRALLHPKTEPAETEQNDVLATFRWAIMNRKPTPFNFSSRERPSPAPGDSS